MHPTAWAEGARKEVDGGAIVIEPIRVTSRKIEEDVRQVPFSVTAVTAEDLEDAGITDTEGLAAQVPNFSYADSGLTFANLINIRGVGSSSALIAPSINYYIDGVPVQTRVFDQAFRDVARVEVLRGPQGTLFGLNSQAGAVSIVTQDPDDVRELAIGGDVGSFGSRKISGLASGRINDSISGRVSGEVRSYDGDIRNFTFNPDGSVASDDRSVREQQSGAFSGKLKADFGDDTAAELSARYSFRNERPTTGLWIDDEDAPRNAYNPIPDSDVETLAAGLTLEHDLGFARLTSVTGVDRYELGLNADLQDGYIMSAQTGASASLFQTEGGNVRDVSENSAQFSQEVRLDGTAWQSLRWVTGVSGLYRDFSSTTDITSAFIANGAYTGDVETLNVAAFGEVTIPVTDRFRVVSGVRQTHERQDYDGVFVGRSGSVTTLDRFTESQEADFTFLTGRVGASYDLTENLSAYATIAKGEKPGGYLYYNQFASMGIPLSEYDSSSTWSYEAGLKGQPLVDWIDFGASVFFNDTKDEQLFTFNPMVGRFDVQNADTETYGLELNLRVRPVASLTLGANLALLETEISGGSNSTILGNDVPYAPNLTTAFFGEYRYDQPIGTREGQLFGRVEYQYTGGRQIDPVNTRELSAFDLVNFRAGWRADALEIHAFVRNVLDEEYFTSAYSAGTASDGTAVIAGVPGEERTFGLQMKMWF